MRVRVNERCQGHTQCVFTAPDVFDLNEEGRAFVTVDPVPTHLEDLARLAVDSCPERAIDIEEDQ